MSRLSTTQGRLYIANADALSCCPRGLTPDVGFAEEEIQIAIIDSDDHPDRKITRDALLQQDNVSLAMMSLGKEQWKDPLLLEVIKFLENGVLLKEDHTC